MVEVTVDASWRMARVEFNTPYDPNGTVIGFGEVLLSDPTTPVSGMRGNGKAYGAMPGATVTRTLSEVVDESVEIDGASVTFGMVMGAMEDFMRKWLVEDESKPEPGPVPPAEALTEVPQLGEQPPMKDELPPPIDPFEPVPEPTPPPDR
jgi:hypothetical protein